jgi:polygalacturonase
VEIHCGIPDQIVNTIAVSDAREQHRVVEGVFMLRRDFLTASSIVTGLSAAGVASAAPLQAARSILDFGAKPDGKTLNTRAIQRAIDAVFQAGGGLVYAPPGNFLTGGLELKSRVTLYLEAGCVLLGSPSISDYTYHPGPPIKGDANGHHLIFAQQAEDVTLCGLGTINGQGENYWEPNPLRPPVSPDEAWHDVASGHYQAINGNDRPSPMVEIVQCRNVRISGVTLMNSAGWTLRPIDCESVFIDGVRIRNPFWGRNTDGMDITACRNVFVSNCDIIGGDDGICLKSENPYGNDVPPSKNITISNCAISSASNGFKMGTATFGAFENIVFSNSVIYSDSGSPMMNRVIGGINIETVDGGSVDGVVISNIRMQNVRAPIFVRLGQRTRREGSFLRNVLIDGVDAEGSIVTSSITGVPGLRPSEISIANCRMRTVAQGQTDWARRNIPEVIDQYPESWMMGRLPAYGFYVRHADRVRLRNIEYITDRPDGRPAILCEDVDDIILGGLELSAPIGGGPLIEMKNTRRAFLTGIRSPEECKIFAQVSGPESAGIELIGNSIPNGQKTISNAADVAKDAVRID